MKDSITFDSKIRLGPSVPNRFDSMAKEEPMLFSCDYNTAILKGGILTHCFLEKLVKEIGEPSDLIIDSRVHMLMPGWYPCIPGWHHDDVPRGGKDNQPIYKNPEYKSKHCLMLINGDLAPTEFALGEAKFSAPVSGQRVYEQWHKECELLLSHNLLTKYYAESNRLIFFDWNTWHRGVPAVKNGWRFFIRASWNTRREFKNEERKQVQVYMDDVNKGW